MSMLEDHGICIESALPNLLVRFYGGIDIIQVRLAPMTQHEYEAFLAHEVKYYAGQHVQVGGGSPRQIRG